LSVAVAVVTAAAVVVVVVVVVPVAAAVAVDDDGGGLVVLGVVGRENISSSCNSANDIVVSKFKARRKMKL
jgi:hypothetical protein